MPRQSRLTPLISGAGFPSSLNTGSSSFARLFHCHSMRAKQYFSWPSYVLMNSSYSFPPSRWRPSASGAFFDSRRGEAGAVVV